MREVNQLIENLEDLNNLIYNEIIKHNENDIRNVTLDLILTQIQGFRTSLVLGRQIDKKWLMTNNNQNYIDEEIKTFVSNFVNYQIDAFFINTFVYIETHIRLIAKHFENQDNKLFNIKITETFDNITNRNKIELFDNIEREDKALMEFYFKLRNTMHNCFFHTWDDLYIVINDKFSVIDKDEKRVELLKNKIVEINPSTKILLIEQVVKIIFKINSKIPNNIIIEHSYINIGYNDI